MGDMGGMGGVDLGDIFGSVFGDMFGGGKRRSARRDGPQEGRDMTYELQISFEEAVYGCDKEISFRFKDTCDRCKGTGAEPGSSRKTCPRCRGRGQIVMNHGGLFQMSTTCPDCGGVGSVIETPCSSCHGSGTRTNSRTLTVHIPAGADTGSRLRSEGNGETGKLGGRNGDLYISLNVKEHTLFERDELDIHCTVPIPFTVAALGGDIDVPTIGGKERLTIPAGTQTGTVFKLPGKGVPSIRNRNRHGDEHVHIVVEVPSNLPAAQKALLKEFVKASDGRESPRCSSFQTKAAKFMK
jgi:molecular chaperone DnaJ